VGLLLFEQCLYLLPYLRLSRCQGLQVTLSGQRGLALLCGLLLVPPDGRGFPQRCNRPATCLSLSLMRLCLRGQLLQTSAQEEGQIGLAST